MQVYRGMDIGTAKDVVAAHASALLMVDIVNPGQDYSVSCYQKAARDCVDALSGLGKVPVICGGTGLYLDSVIDEMTFPAGGAKTESRQAYQHMAETLGAHGLHEELARRDPASAAVIHENNVRRVIRALELTDEGLSYADEVGGLRRLEPRYDARIWTLTMNRERLYSRIDERVDAMMHDGLLDEVRRLVDKGYGDALTSMQAIGYKELLAHLDGKLSLPEAVELIKRNTRRYAKRQLSWIRRDGRATSLDMDSLSNGEACDMVLEDLRTNPPRQTDSGRRR